MYDSLRRFPFLCFVELKTTLEMFKLLGLRIRMESTAVDTLAVVHCSLICIHTMNMKSIYSRQIIVITYSKKLHIVDSEKLASLSQ